jgi:hypothetical protein
MSSHRDAAAGDQVEDVAGTARLLVDAGSVYVQGEHQALVFSVQRGEGFHRVGSAGPVQGEPGRLVPGLREQQGWRYDFSTLGVEPPAQRLQSDDRFPLERHLGLKVRDQRTIFNDLRDVRHCGQH